MTKVVRECLKYEVMLYLLLVDGPFTDSKT